jgi:peroxiredoxin
MIKSTYYFALALLLCGLSLSFKLLSDEHKSLEIGAKAPDFNLPGVDGKMYTLNSFKKSPILVIVFTCNHCPTAQAYEDRIIQLTKDYGNKGAAVVAIMPNDPHAIRLDELGYTDLSDSFAEMKIRARQKHFNFPYLYDGDKQTTAKAYGPTATPHVFIFDKDRKLCYSGRIDDVEKPGKIPNNQDTRSALNSLLKHEKPAVSKTKVFGCSIKWAEKENWKLKAQEEWSIEPVKIDTIGVNGIKDLLKNKSDNLRLINIWATWCGPCTTEFPEFITMNRMYRKRDFEIITISADDPTKEAKALKFLKQAQASTTNYIFNKDDKYKLIEAIDPKWQGALPYTLLVEPGGKIVFAKQGIINPSELKKAIVENPLIGRYY